MKSIGLLAALVAAVLAMVPVTGGGEASATVLCRVNENPCAVGNRYGEKTVFSAKINGGEAATFQNVFNKCTEAEIVGETQKNEGKGAALSGEITFLGFEKCENCPTKAVNLPYKAEFKPAMGGSLTLSNKAAGNPGVYFEKCFGLNCEYASASIVFPLKGGKPSILSLPIGSTILAKQKASDFKCSATMEWWKTELEFENPTGGEVWVSAEP